MGLRIITADERMAQGRGVKALLVGRAGIGKTWQLHTMDRERTLFIDLEAGDLSVQDVEIATIQPKTWEQCRDIACLLGGPNPSLPASAPYSEQHYKTVHEALPDVHLEHYNTYFVDSITVAGRLCFRWSHQQPEATVEKTGKPDLRGAYGLHAREMIGWLTQLQHARAKNVIFVGILEKVTDEFGQSTHQLQIEGAKTGRELPGIVDQVITLEYVKWNDQDQGERAFICHPNNPYGFPAKDRSGRLDMFEKPDLGWLIQKITKREASKLPASHELSEARMAV